MKQSKKSPTPQKIFDIAIEYENAINYLQELGLAEIQGNAGAKLNPKLHVELIGEIPPELKEVVI